MLRAPQHPMHIREPTIAAPNPFYTPIGRLCASSHFVHIGLALLRHRQSGTHGALPITPPDAPCERTLPQPVMRKPHCNLASLRRYRPRIASDRFVAQKITISVPYPSSGNPTSTAPLRGVAKKSRIRPSARIELRWIGRRSQIPSKQVHRLSAT